MERAGTTRPVENVIAAPKARILEAAREASQT